MSRRPHTTPPSARPPRHLTALICLAMGFSACGETTPDTHEAADLDARRGALTGLAAVEAAPSEATRAEDDLLLPAVLAAIESGQVTEVDALLLPRWETSAAGLRPVSGAHQGVRGAQTLSVLVEDPSNATLTFWSAEDVPVLAELHAAGALPVAVEVTSTPGPRGGYLHTIARDGLGEGLLLVGKEGVALSAMGDDAIALPSFRAQWRGEGVQPTCEPGAYRCLLSAHAEFVVEDLQIARTATEGARPADQLGAYISKHNSIGAVEALPGARDLDVVVRFKAPPKTQPEVYLVAPDGDRKRAPYETLTTLKDGRVEAAFTIPSGTPRDALIVVDTAPGATPTIATIGVTGIPGPVQAFDWPWEPRVDWRVTGCLTVDDDETVWPQQTRPVAGVEVQLKGARYFGIFGHWATGRTDANGCFDLRARHSAAPRDLRVDMRFDGALLRVRNQWDVLARLNGWWFNLWQVNGQGAGTMNLGGMRFAPGQPGELGQQRRQRQAIAWFTGHQLHEDLRAQDPWFGFSQPWTMSYPDTFVGLFTLGLATGILRPTAFVRDTDDWMDTLLHETGHIWHYMHQSGTNWDILASALHGGGTHDCQETESTAFLEGFAEFFKEHAECHPDLWITGRCNGESMRPYSLDHLRNLDACVNNGQTGLTTPARVARNDDGVQHALNLLVVDDLYRHNFLGTGERAWRDSSTLLNQACEWYPFDGLDFFDVLDTMRGRPGHSNPAYQQHFSTSPGWGIDQFYTRFRALNFLPAGFERDRRRYWNATLTQNPDAFCAQSCQEPTSWWDGSDPVGNFDGANCALMPIPAGGFISGNAYYIPEQETCPQGTQDANGCHIHTPAPGTTAFTYNNNMYTTPLITESCAIGTLAGSGPLPCFVGSVGEPGAPNSDDLVYDQGGRLYAEVDGIQCAQLGGVPAGPMLCDLGALQGASYLVHWGFLYVGAAQTKSCPDGTLDPLNCYIGTPSPGTTSFVHNGQLYTTTLRSCAQGDQDNTGCRLGTPPAGRGAFTSGGLFYYTSN